MYNFVLRKWKDGGMTEVQVYTLVPTFLTQAQADAIVATPRDIDA